jgi:hypothetical protein
VVGGSNPSGRAFPQKIQLTLVDFYCSSVAIRTADRQQTEFDKSPQAIWSPAGRAERERGQGAVGPAAISPGAQKIFHWISQLVPPPLARLAPKPGGCGGFAGLCNAHFLGGLDQARQLRLGVVRRDATTTDSTRSLLPHLVPKERMIENAKYLD